MTEEVSIRKKGASKACQFKTEEFDRSPSFYGIERAKQLLLSQDYGSGSEIKILDLETCKEVPFKFEGHMAKLNDQSIEFSSTCEPTNQAGKCNCSKASVYSLSEACSLQMDLVASAALTKKELGIDNPLGPMDCPKK